MIVRDPNPTTVVYAYTWTCPTCQTKGKAETYRAANRNLKRHWAGCPDPRRVV